MKNIQKQENKSFNFHPTISKQNSKKQAIFLEMFEYCALDIAKPFLEEELSAIKSVMDHLPQQYKEIYSFLGIGVGPAIYSSELLQSGYH